MSICGLFLQDQINIVLLPGISFFLMIIMFSFLFLFTSCLSRSNLLYLFPVNSVMVCLVFRGCITKGPVRSGNWPGAEFHFFIHHIFVFLPFPELWGLFLVLGISSDVEVERFVLSLKMEQH